MTYYILLLFVLWLNRKDDRALTLITIVAFTVIFPYKYITEHDAWYAAVCIAECLIIFSALAINTNYTSVLCLISILMLTAHITNYVHYSPQTYKSIIVFLEHLHLITFIITSNPVMKTIKRNLQWMLRL